MTKQNPYFSDEPNIVVFDLDPDTMSFKAVQGNAEALLGFPVDAWLHPEFWPERIHVDDRDDVMGFCARCIREGRDHELEYRVVDAVGETKWVHEVMEFGPRGAEPGTLRGYLMDITRRVAHEADIQQALALKDELMRIVSEELSNPVNEISGFSAMLERHLSAQHDDVGSDYVLGVRTGVERLRAFIEQFRSFPPEKEVDFDRVSDALCEISDELAENEIN